MLRLPGTVTRGASGPQPTAHFLLPTALLPTAFRLLPTALRLSLSTILPQSSNGQEALEQDSVF
jgi:hypothetical protein